MGVYINGMEMPKETPVLFCVHPDGKVFADLEGGWKEYKAVAVPPHGRLIDADKQDAQIEALIERHLHGYTKSTWDFVCELRDILKRNRTIIPAEEGET